MESRGGIENGRLSDRPAIARRSCDQCRVRKIGCDRGSPCVNCTSARLSCTRSAVSVKPTAPKQRVLISEQYERKIDGIARGIDSIKLLLHEHQTAPTAGELQSDSFWRLNQGHVAKRLSGRVPISITTAESVWNHSAHITDFVKAVVRDASCEVLDPKVAEVLSLLRNLVKVLENPAAVQEVSFAESQASRDGAALSMPPLDAVVAVLRWAKDHAKFNRIVWISKILPLEMFTEICRKVYFAVDDYGETDFILANGCLSYLFSEHVVASGLQQYREYCDMCRKNLRNALFRLPLLLPASMETIAALAFGTFDSIQNSKANTAWTFVSTAARLCQTLGYHRQRPLDEADEPLQFAKDNLFWTIHALDKGLSLRLGRPSNMPDTEVTLTLRTKVSRSTRLARIQGKIYDQLYSTVGLSRSDTERGQMAAVLAAELRQALTETRFEISEPTESLEQSERDRTRLFYLQCDLVCQTSLLALTLRAIPATQGSPNEASDDCVAAARETLDLHQQCMMSVTDCPNDPFMVTTYLNWSIMHIPFVPFSILFTRTIQLLDVDELARLDRFTASLQTEPTDPESITHPYRLYELLCHTAHIYIELKGKSTASDSTFVERVPHFMGELDIEQFGTEAEFVASQTLEASGIQTTELSDWYYSNQQFMSLLDEDMMF